MRECVACIFKSAFETHRVLRLSNFIQSRLCAPSAGVTEGPQLI